MKPASDITEFSQALATGGGVAATANAAAQLDRADETPSRLRDFYELTKPRMNFLVVCTTAVGFAMAPHHGHWVILVHAIIGTALTAASASVLNQLVERAYDALMPRTRNRPLPGGRITPGEALAFGIVLGVIGVGYLLLMVNLLTALLGAFTLASYVWVYTPLKRVTSLNTVVGAIPGAIPPMMGWAAATGALGPEAIALFAIMFLWQMPHFLAIAILYQRDYAAGGFKMLPVIDPKLRLTSRMIVLYGIALIPVSLTPVGVGMAGSVYLAGAVLMGLAFFSYCVSCAVSKERIDARKLFFASIIYLPLLFAVMMIDKV
ncbi:MAG: protoheme farnesyltransferase [Phycisphaerales bacterium]|nr:protoheme farnesyltransferase [Phycisphaerales bacterium]